MQSRYIHSSYCLTKYSLKHEFINYQDHDEFIVFNKNKFNNFWEVISHLRMQYGNNIGALKIKDTPFYNDCNDTTNVNYSSFILPAVYLKSDVSLNDGKSIYQADSCYIQHPHDCLLRRTAGQFQQTRSSARRSYGGNYINMNYNGKDILRSFHYRTAINPDGEQCLVGSKVWCGKSHFERIDWLDSILPVLKTKCLETLATLNAANQTWMS
ncbi:uncharacterized protein LOC142357703 [Convolutriloba macropyga]|uniref:uncharacterized protein LOC142357703 n=1 Tax=Convolutriloba macropyga TaxID=536237 RepID=UPI003F51E9E5